MAVQSDAFQFGQSPDGRWFWGIEGVGYLEEGTDLNFHKTNFASVDGKIIWTVWPKTEDIGAVGDKQTTYQPIFWQPGEPYVYLTGDSCCRDGAYGHTGMNLARLNLQTGDFAILISGWIPRSFAFSAMGEYLLVTEYKNPQLRFIRLSDWKITDISIDPKYIHNDLGAFSPLGNRAVVQKCEELGDTLGCYRRGLVLVNIQDGDYRVLLDDLYNTLELDSDRDFRYGLTFDWLSESEIAITARARGKNDRRFVFDLGINQLHEVIQK